MLSFSFLSIAPTPESNAPTLINITMKPYEKNVKNIMSAAFTIPSNMDITIFAGLTGVCSRTRNVPGTTNVRPVVSSRARSNVPDGTSHVSIVAKIINDVTTTKVCGFLNFFCFLFL